MADPLLTFNRNAKDVACDGDGMNVIGGPLMGAARLLAPVLLPLCFAPCGCGDARVDGSSDEKLKASIAEVKQALPEAQRAEFEKAVETLALADMHDLSDLVAASQTGRLERGIRERLDGKTAAEIIAAAKVIQAEREQRRKEEEARRKREEAERAEQERQELAEMEARQRQREAEREKQKRRDAIAEIDELAGRLAEEKPDILAMFVVERATFGYSETLGMREPKMEVAVRNGTGRAVSRAYFSAVLLTPARALPWLDEEFNYAIPGGLESGEAATWRLAPNMFGEWATAPKDRDDMVLIVRPVRLDGPGGKPLSGPPLSAQEAKRLRELLATVQHDRGAELLATLDARDTAAQAWRAQAVAVSVRAEAEHLRDRKVKADAARASLAKFVVEQARFYWHKDLVPEPVIDIAVRNNTGHVVSRLHCRGVLSSPGRAAPWVEEDFVYAVRGGLQPGEQQQYKLAPNMFSSWGKAPRDRTDLVLTVTVVRLDGADEKELFPSDFAERDAKRLAALDKILEPDGK